MDSTLDFESTDGLESNDSVDSESNEYDFHTTLRPSLGPIPTVYGNTNNVWPLVLTLIVFFLLIIAIIMRFGIIFSFEIKIQFISVVFRDIKTQN